jgi:hypothetical protein
MAMSTTAPSPPSSPAYPPPSPQYPPRSPEYPPRSPAHPPRSPLPTSGDDSAWPLGVSDPSPRQVRESALEKMFRSLQAEGVASLYGSSYGIGFDRLVVHDLQKLNDGIEKMVTENEGSLWKKTENFGDHVVTSEWFPCVIISRLYSPVGPLAQLPHARTQQLCYTEWIREDDRYRATSAAWWRDF